MNYPGTSAQASKVEALLFKSPEDIKGIGTISIQYADGRLPDLYAYIKAVRRIRRLSSGGWADPISAIDFLNDESFALNADPRWYDQWNLKEKRWILGSPHAISSGIQLNERDPNKRYSNLNFASKPFGGLKEEYEPREVWVVEVIMPKTHLNSKKSSTLKPILIHRNCTGKKCTIARVSSGAPWSVITRIKKVATGIPCRLSPVVLYPIINVFT